MGMPPTGLMELYTRKRGQRENRKSALSIRGQTREKGAEQEGAGVRTGVREDEEERRSTS